MPPGPVLIFDKSALESLNPDESVWLDNFFICNITPLFYIETLADLEKELKSGRTPEQVVGNLAYKTPDMESNPNVHHSRLLSVELLGLQEIVLDGRLHKSGGRVVDFDGKKGVMFQMAQEEEALCRWKQGEFLDLERQLAKAWRRALTNIDYAQICKLFERFFVEGKPKSLVEAKRLADTHIDAKMPEFIFRFGMSLLGTPEETHKNALRRWLDFGKPPIRQFAPYFSYVLSVDLFFCISVAADLISRVRPAGKVDNKVDIAYLYYLPFCSVFTSRDNLHQRVVPLFLRSNQSFVNGGELKADLSKLDEHYAALPEEVKVRGLHHFAGWPPSDPSFLVTRLWDRHLPDWRKSQSGKKELSKELQDALLKIVKSIEEKSKSSDPAKTLTVSETDYIQIKRTIARKKGKWMRVGPDVK